MKPDTARGEATARSIAAENLLGERGQSEAWLARNSALLHFMPCSGSVPVLGALGTRSSRQIQKT